MEKNLQLDALQTTKWFNYFIKASLFVAFFIAIFFPPEVLEGKGMAARAPLFLAPAILVPIIAKVKGWKSHPHLADGLLSMPFLLDTLGNLFGFYDSINATDDVLHFINWVFLVGAFHAFRFRNESSNKESLLLGAGFGAIMIIVWEIFEWFISDEGPFAGDVPDALSLTYGDTIGDLFISFSGGVVGTLLARHYLGAAKK